MAVRAGVQLGVYVASLEDSQNGKQFRRHVGGEGEEEGGAGRTRARAPISRPPLPPNRPGPSSAARGP